MDETKPLYTSSRKPICVPDWTRVMMAASLVLVALALAVVLASVFVSASDKLQTTIYLEATPERTGVSSGEVGQRLWGPLTLDQDGNVIKYALLKTPGLSSIQSLVVRGPIPAGQTIGPIAFSLCGLPNAVTVCDDTTVPGQVSGSQLQLEPGPIDVRPVLLAILSARHQYYLEVLTTAFPTSPGALRAELF